MEYKTIICPIDGSELTGKAAEQAAYISKLSGAKVTLLHIVEKWYRSSHLTTDSKEWQAIHEEWLNKGREVLEKEAARLKARGIKEIDTVLKEGDAAHEIVATAVEENADIIIMATHRYSPMGKLFIGSVTDKVSKHAPCPVMWVFA